MKRKFRFSLRAKFSIIFAAIIIFVILVIAVTNKILLSKVYYANKNRQLTEAYNVINGVFTEENADSVELEKIYSAQSITIFISDSEGQTVFSSLPSEKFAENRAENRPDFKPKPESKPESKPGGQRSPRENRSFSDYIKNELKEGQYEISEENDSRLGTSFLRLTARLNNGYSLYMQTSLDAVDDAVDTANTLLIYIGAMAFVLGIIIVTAAMTAATKPIRELTEIAGDMSELKFGRKYTVKHRDEIGELGQSINILSDKLEKAVSELEKSNERLEKDIRIKEAVDKMRKEFIAEASHELKTPLALISGYAEGLKSNIAASPEDREFYCEVILDETARMDKIIRQFLTVTELEEERTFEKKRMDFSAMVKETVKSCAVLAEQCGVNIEVHCEDGVFVNGNETVLRQAVINYITNALHYADERKKVVVSLSAEDGKAKLGVFNSGSHIPDEAADRIWDSFYKVDKARTRSYGGSGLGLAIVKKCVELHGGRFGFENTDDGVEFFFEIETYKEMME